MQKRISLVIGLLVSLTLITLGSQRIPSKTDKISVQQIRQLIIDKHNLVKHCAGREAISRLDVEFNHDFDGDGRDEVVVNATTCNGQALAVYAVHRGGYVVEMPIECLGDDRPTSYCQKFVFARFKGRLSLAEDKRLLVLKVPLEEGTTRRVYYRFNRREKSFEMFNTEIFDK